MRAIILIAATLLTLTAGEAFGQNAVPCYPAGPIATFLAEQHDEAIERSHELENGKGTVELWVDRTTGDGSWSIIVRKGPIRCPVMDGMLWDNVPFDHPARRLMRQLGGAAT